MTYAGNDRQSVLEAGGRREGALTLYTTGTTTGPILEAFQKKYPFIKLNVQRADSVEITRKTMEEYGANYYDVDAFDLSTNGLIPLRDQTILQPFVSSEMAALLPASIETDHYWASDRLTFTGLGFNTDAISIADAPKTYRDFLDPKWKGRMAISGLAGTAANWVGAMLLSEGEDYVRALGRQNLRVYPITARAVANLMISGEVKISPDSYYDHVTSSKAAGAPLAWIAPGPVPVLDTAVAIAARAPHPHAALLFVDFMLGREAQKMLADLRYISPRVDMPKGDQPEVEKLFVANRPHYTEEFESWNKLLNEVFLRPVRH
ncbi:MAG TPA: extracellular solute-binding protein [Beijerinckiaceae bacterium]|nr:extracellular solute-binding protein [Beijerinckiaceae bacterium]